MKKMVIQMYVSENFEFKFSRVKSHLKIDLIITMLFNTYFLYRKSSTIWVTDKELPIAGKE